MNTFKDYEVFLERLRTKIENLEYKINSKDYGRVIEVGDGIATIVGLDGVTLGEIVTYLDDGLGMVMRIEYDYVNVMLFNKLDEVQEGIEMFSTKKQLTIPVGKSLLGRVINALGEPIDGLGALESVECRNVECDAPGIMDRSSVCEPLQTGIKIIDALIPIGLGQKQLILGDRQSGKSAIALDTILNQKNVKDDGGKFAYCIYVAIGKKNSEIAKIYELFKKKGSLENTIIIAASASDSAAMQYVAPMAGAAIAEYFRDAGQHALVVFDDLTKHADAYRELSLLMRRTPARGAYPGDIFYLHSRLLERAVKMRESLGGGSVTMLPIIETQAGDVSDYIPTNVISITDGQIYLDKQLFFDGQKPAVNIGLSVSRIGAAAQYRNMKNIAASLKGELAQFREYESFAKSVSDLDSETKKMIKRGRLLMSLFRQPMYAPQSLAKMIISLFAGIRGLLDKHDFDDIYTFENELFEYIFNHGNEIVYALSKNLHFDDDMQAQLIVLIKTFLEQK